MMASRAGILALLCILVVNGLGCDASNQGCKKTKNGADYTGTISVTRSGKTCQRWRKQCPHKHKFLSNFPDGDISSANNYCRNPGSDPDSGGPWCYTTDHDTRWEYCDIPDCQLTECKTSKRGFGYAGTKSVTYRGHTCQSWKLQSPHKHKYNTGKLFPGSDIDASKNYCRNPNATEQVYGPWCYVANPQTRWAYCDIEMCPGDENYECKEDTIGKSYQGKTSKTSAGLTCQAWASNSPHQHDWSHKPLAFPDGNLQNASNYCRNLDGDSGGPWCYTTDPSVRWGYCSVELCSTECLSDIEGRTYNGKLNVTHTGKTCQSWSSQSPHNHKLLNGEGFPGYQRVGSKNYCRNPGRDTDEGGPWCYTTDPDTRWEYCNIKLCSHN